MKKVIIGIGMPGSGKTTTLKKFATKNDYFYICADDIREEFTGSATNQSKNKEVWIEAYRRVKEQLTAGKTVVFDATFTNQGQRKDFLTFARENGAEKIQGIYLCVDLNTAKERIQNRERKVSEFVLERMNRDLEYFPPELNDGFDSLCVLDEQQNLKEVKLARENRDFKKEFGVLH
jgi:predicted kinase